MMLPPPDRAHQGASRSALQTCAPALLIACALCFGAAQASAADTVEAWDAGWADVDHYLGWDGVTRARGEQVFFGDIMLGYGVADGLSAYLGTTIEANGFLAQGATSFYLGAYGSAVDTDHFDLDIFLDIGSGGPDGFAVTPALEINFDVRPDLALAGLYVRPALPVWGETDLASGASRGAYDLEAVFGGYTTVSERHMIHIEYDMTFLPVTLGGLALGYNAVIGDSLELIHEVRFDIPEGSEEPGLAVMVGFIATIPGANAAAATPEVDDELVELPLTLGDLRAGANAPDTRTPDLALAAATIDPERDSGIVFARTWSLQPAVDRVDIEQRDRVDLRAFDVGRDGRISLVLDVADPTLEGDWALLDVAGNPVHAELLVGGRCTYLLASTSVKRGRYFVRVRATKGGSDYTLSGRINTSRGHEDEAAEALWWRSTASQTGCGAASEPPLALEKPVPLPPTRIVEGRLELVSEGDERGAIVMIYGTPALDGVLASMRGHIEGIGSVVTTTFCDEGKCRATLETGVGLALLPQYNLVRFEVPAPANPRGR